MHQLRNGGQVRRALLCKLRTLLQVTIFPTPEAVSDPRGLAPKPLDLAAPGLQVYAHLADKFDPSILPLRASGGS